MELGPIIKGVVANRLKRLEKEKEAEYPETQRQNILKAWRSLEGFQHVGTRFDGNFTTIVIGDGVYQSIGVAKRNPADTYNAKRGMHLAASRAVKAALDAAL